MADCPLAEDCPSFSEQIAGMGCQHYGDRSGKEWCNHYSQPIQDLKTQPVKVGEEIVVDVEDIHESGAGVGRTEDGFIIMIDGLLPEVRARVKVTKVFSNHAQGEELERLPEEPDEDENDGDEDVESEKTATTAADKRPEKLGSRENFWGS